VPEDEVSVLLDLGAEETHVTLQRGRHLLFARTVSFGGRQFTAALQQQLQWLASEAEAWKKAEARILPREEEALAAEQARAASQALRSQVGTLAGNVQSSIRFFQAQFQCRELSPTRVYLTGGASRLGGWRRRWRTFSVWRWNRFSSAP